MANERLHSRANERTNECKNEWTSEWCATAEANRSMHNNHILCYQPPSYWWLYTVHTHTHSYILFRPKCGNNSSANTAMVRLKNKRIERWEIIFFSFTFITANACSTKKSFSTTHLRKEHFRLIHAVHAHTLSHIQELMCTYACEKLMCLNAASFQCVRVENFRFYGRRSCSTHTQYSYIHYSSVHVCVCDAYACM